MSIRSLRQFKEQNNKHFLRGFVAYNGNMMIAFDQDLFGILEQTPQPNPTFQLRRPQHREGVM